MKTSIKIIRQFSDNDKTYFPGEIYKSPYEIARRYISRGDAEWLEGNNEDLTGGRINHPKVSIVILIKDALKYVEKCIRSLNENTHNFELILVDNGSNADTKDWLAKLDWLDYTLIENKENKGFSYGCNQGIKVAKYDYICFLNSDTLLSPNWLGKLMRGFKYSNDVGVVGPSTCHCATIQSPQVWKTYKYAGQEEVNRISTMFAEDYIEQAVVGFCFVFKKEVFDKIGVFDYKRYGIACHEDIDLVWRACKAGYRSIWAQASYVHHYGNRTTREMGLNPKEIRKKNKPIFDHRLSDPNLYVKNDVKLGKVKRIKGRIPILMITWNRLEYTKQAVEAIRKNTKNPYKLFIWDNASTDGTKEWLMSLDEPNIQVAYQTDNVGLIPPMNNFFKIYSNYRYVAKVDNDTIVGYRWLTKLKEVMDEYPFFAVEADHYLMLNYDIKDNKDYYNELFSIDFKGHKLYLAEIVGGTGTIIRRSMIGGDVPEMPGTLSGWIQYQHLRENISAFYTGVWVDRLDQTGTNQYREPSDYPEYDKKIDQLRKRNRTKKPIKKGMFKSTYQKTKEWYERL